ncbi:MAG: hypothetical protein HYZ49_11640 [Chloroflexi bacterium]|nr:hypothetical protein [Chloroflexota bacterium]
MMKRPIVWILIAAFGIVGAVVAALLLAQPQPTELTGDPWDYNLSPADLPEGWSLKSSRIQTAFELDFLASSPDSIPSQTGLRSTHYADFESLLATDVFYVSSQILLYDTTQNAHAALTAEALGEEWEPVATGKTVGDETMIWHLKSIPEAPNQASYRIDFRYLNGVGSIGLTGLTDSVKDSSAALDYAAKIFARMQKAARPEALKTLSYASQPDLRKLLLTQAELSELDARLGERWVFDDRDPPAWTPNASFTDPDGLARFGRIMGYQTFMIKLLNPDEVKPDLSAGFFQQVTAYKEADKAQQILENMAGLGDGPWPTQPQIGDSARAWSSVYKSEGNQSQIVAVTEINFRAGTYIGSVRLQTAPILAAQIKDAQEANQQLAQQLAAALAAKLGQAQP